MLSLTNLGPAPIMATIAGKVIIGIVQQGLGANTMRDIPARADSIARQTFESYSSEQQGISIKGL